MSKIAYIKRKVTYLSFKKNPPNKNRGIINAGESDAAVATEFTIVETV